MKLQREIYTLLWVPLVCFLRPSQDFRKIKERGGGVVVAVTISSKQQWDNKNLGPKRGFVISNQKQ
jgi:hypothetical protein